MVYVRDTMTGLLETSRLRLRGWHLSDLADFYEYIRQPDVGPSAGWLPVTNLKDCKALLTTRFIGEPAYWALELKANRKVLGSIGLTKDVKRSYPKAFSMGYSMNHDYWGQGLMTEAARRIVRHAFEDLGVELLSCYHYGENLRSRRVIEKCGFVFEGVLRQCSWTPDGLLHDDYCYSLTREDFLNGRREE